MKKKVFGRKSGSQEPMVLLLESDGVSTGDGTVDPLVLDQFGLANTRRQVAVLRDRNIEGYVVFENDPTRYEFTPQADFLYPAVMH